MKYARFLMLSVACICTLAFIGVASHAQEGRAVLEQAGTMVGAPSALHLKIAGDGFQLAWTRSPQDPGTVNGYELVRADRFSGPYETVAMVGKGISQYHDSSASSEIIYYYKVRAIAGKEYSPFSNTVSGER